MKTPWCTLAFFFLFGLLIESGDSYTFFLKKRNGMMVVPFFSFL